MDKIGAYLCIVFALLLIIVLVSSKSLPVWGDILLVMAGIAFIGSLFTRGGGGRG